MVDFFSDDVRRNPYPLYVHLRTLSPVIEEPASGLWMVSDYDGVYQLLTEVETFSSRAGPDWMIFTDPPRHTKLRALVARAFTPKSVAALEPRIRELSRGLLDAVAGRGEMDLAADYAVPLPMLVIAEMLGVPAAGRARYVRWNDVLLDMSYTIPGVAGAGDARNAFVAATAEMGDYLACLLEERRRSPKDDLLTRLVEARVDGEGLTHAEIVGFFQLLLLAGSETTTNLINNAVLCFIDFPEQLATLRAAPSLLPSAIEEVLRYRAPLQWMYRLTTRDVELHGREIPAHKIVLALIGAANRDPKVFPDAERFDVTRDPNPHLAFGHGHHFCMGAPLARLEARIAIGDVLDRMTQIELASNEPWPPRRGLHVHGPSRLPIRFKRRGT